MTILNIFFSWFGTLILVSQYKYAAIRSVVKCVGHKIEGVVEVHNEPFHGWIGNGCGSVIPDLACHQWDDGAPNRHHVAVSGTTNNGTCIVVAA